MFFSLLATPSYAKTMSCAQAKRAYERQRPIVEALGAKYDQAELQFDVTRKACDTNPSEMTCDQFDDATLAASTAAFAYAKAINSEADLMDILNECDLIGLRPGRTPVCHSVPLGSTICD